MRRLFAALGFFLIIWMALLWRFSYLINSSDLFQYLSISGKYINGNFPAAFNSFYSPLLSWLFVPLLSAGLHYWWAYVIIQFTAGIFIIFYVNKLLEKLALPGNLIFLFAPLPAIFGLFHQSPDLLFLLFFLILIYRGFFIESPSIKGALITGFFGALLFFSKSVGYLFFTAFAGFSIGYFYFIKKGNLNFTRNMLLSLAVMFVFVFGWWAVISWNEGHFTRGTTAAYNRAIFHPDNTPQGFWMAIFDHPFNQDGLYPPPNESAVNAWEQPMKLEYKTWSIAEHPTHLLKIIWHNVFNLIWINEWSMSLLALLWLLFLRPVYVFRSLQNQPFFILISAAFILTAGYSLILVQGRYLWGASIALWLAGWYLLRDFPVAGYLKWPAIILLFAALPYGYGEIVRDEWNQHKSVQQLVSLTSEIPPGSRVANMEWEKNRAYELATAICYELKLQHYGNVPENWNYLNQKAELEKHRIAYYLTFKPGDTTTFGGILLASNEEGFRLIKLPE